MSHRPDLLCDMVDVTGKGANVRSLAEAIDEEVRVGVSTCIDSYIGHWCVCLRATCHGNSSELVDGFDTRSLYLTFWSKHLQRGVANK